jgi:hypothetical protein
MPVRCHCTRLLCSTSSITWAGTPTWKCTGRFWALFEDAEGEGGRGLVEQRARQK